MNGKNLTKKQKSKIARIVKLFNELEKDGVRPLIIEPGGYPALRFIRDGDLDIEILEKNRWIGNGSNNFYDTSVCIDMWVP